MSPSAERMLAVLEREWRPIIILQVRIDMPYGEAHDALDELVAAGKAERQDLRTAGYLWRLKR